MKKVITVILLLAFVILISGCNSDDSNEVNTEPDKVVDYANDKEDIKDNEEKGEEVMDDSCINSQGIYLSQTATINSSVLWENSAVCENLKLEDSTIKLTDIGMNGTLETNDFFVEPFTELVPTWNVLMDESSTIAIFVSIGNSDGYSEYYTMGLWREVYKTSFTNQEDEYGRTSIDTIIPKLDNIDRIKFKIVFTKSDTETMALKNVSITTVPKNNNIDFDDSVLEEKVIAVTARQQLSIPLIGNSICSPTSLSMVLNYYNHTESQDDVAGLVYDEGASIYGNWSFNASYAGGFNDLYSRVEYANELSTLMKYINEDKPVVLSIKTTSKEALEGTIMSYPAGHLIVLTGFKLINDEWYAVVNDPAEYEDSKVTREYKLDELLEAWRGYLYIIQQTPFE